MKKLISFFLVTVVSLFVLSSCNKNNGHDYGRYYISYGEISENYGDFEIKLDNGSKLEIVSNKCPNFKMSDELRVIVNFSTDDPIADDKETGVYKATINAIDSILTKRTILESELDTQEKVDSIGNDNIEVGDVWFSAGKYLNVVVAFNYNKEKHFINGVVTSQEGNNVTIEVRHNANDDKPYYGTKSLVSFLIDDLFPADSDELNVTLKWTNYDDEVETKTTKISLSDDSDDASTEATATAYTL